MEKFVKRRALAVYPGIRVTRDTVLQLDNGRIRQWLENLLLCTVTDEWIKGELNRHHTIGRLREGDVLILDPGGCGYVQPGEEMLSLSQVPDTLAQLEEEAELCFT